MNIFLQEMKAHRKSLIFWCLGMIFMIIAGMGKFSAYSTSGQSINDLVDQMPKSVRIILGFGDFDVSKASGYFGLLFIYLLLMAAIHAVMLGANIISKEERDKTSEFLFVKPVSRNKVINSKLSAALANIAILNIITLISSIAIEGKYSNGENINAEITLLMVGMFIIQLIFMSIGSGLAAVSKNPKTATGAATGILLFTYVLSILADMNTKLENLKYFTPFKYIKAESLIKGGGFDLVFIVLSILIITVLIYGTYKFYKKRDLNV